MAQLFVGWDWTHSDISDLTLETYVGITGVIDHYNHVFNLGLGPWRQEEIVVDLKTEIANFSGDPVHLFGPHHMADLHRDDLTRFDSFDSEHARAAKWALPNFNLR